jgi:hypothetical protein
MQGYICMYIYGPELQGSYRRSNSLENQAVARCEDEGAVDIFYLVWQSS